MIDFSLRCPDGHIVKDEGLTIKRVKNGYVLQENKVYQCHDCGPEIYYDDYECTNENIRIKNNALV